MHSTQFAVAEALLLHLALEGPDLLEPSLLVLDVLSEALQLLLLGGLLLLTLLLLLQVAQPLLLETQRNSQKHNKTDTNFHPWPRVLSKRPQGRL